LANSALIPSIENFVNQYVSSYANLNSFENRLYIDTNLGDESKRIFRNNINIENLNHYELSLLAGLVTRELKAQVNDDHFTFWTWCGHVIHYCKVSPSVPMPNWFRSDYDLINSFKNIINLILMHKYADISIELFSELTGGSFTISASLSFAVLEGLLRRLNSSFVNNDGSVHTQFSVTYSNGRSRVFKVKERLNQINDSFRLFENTTCVNRKRNCSGLAELKKEIFNLYGSSREAYDLLNEWRNDLVHGNQYWNNKIGVVLNAICLLMLDTIGPTIYDGKISDFQKYANKKRQNHQNLNSNYEIYLRKL
jgi:hypothetical protein